MNQRACLGLLVLMLVAMPLGMINLGSGAADQPAERHIEYGALG